MPNEQAQIVNMLRKIVDELDEIGISVGGNPIDAYAGGTTYQKGDIVSYTDDSSDNISTPENAEVSLLYIESGLENSK